MEITESLKKHFCKDYNINIQIFREPIFTDRLFLMDKINEYSLFCNTVNNFINATSFLSYGNELRNKIVSHIKDSEAYKSLISCDMNKYAIPEKYAGIQTTDVYRDKCVGKYYISIDMCKANFTSLVHYGEANGCPFFENYDYSEFMKQFTKYDYFADSKYIRQVVFGHCNPKRQTSYERYLITTWLENLEKRLEYEMPHYELPIHSIMSDEIIISTIDVFSIDKFNSADRDVINLIYDILDQIKKSEFPLKMEYFKVLKIRGTKSGYIKKNFDIPFTGTFKYEVKCVQPYEAPAVYRALFNNKHNYTEDSQQDCIFMFDGHEAVLTEPLDISIEGDD